MREVEVLKIKYNPPSKSYAVLLQILNSDEVTAIPVGTRHFSPGLRTIFFSKLADKSNPDAPSVSYFGIIALWFNFLIKIFVIN